jgi:F-type H+-transporting ATPase subunit gamma
MNNMKKITNTMKVVASTKLTRASRAMEESRKYGETSQEVFEAAETKVPEVEDKKSLIIVCSSDRGLCGGIHSGLSRRIRKLFAANGPSDLVVIGEKCRAQLSRSNPQSLQLTFAGVGRNVPTFADAQAIADQIALLPTEYTDVKILYNKFINATSYEPTFIEAFSEDAITQSRKCDEDEIVVLLFILIHICSQFRRLRGRGGVSPQPPRVLPRQLSVLGSCRGPRLRDVFPTKRHGRE